MRSHIGWYTIHTYANSVADAIHKARTPRAIEALQCSEATAPTFSDQDGCNPTSKTGRVWLMRFQVISLHFHVPCCGRVSVYFTSDASEEYFQLGIKHPNQPTSKSNALQDLTCCKFQSSHLLLERFSSCRSCNWPDNFYEAAKLQCVSSIKWVPELLKQTSPDAPKLSGKDTSWLSDKLTPSWFKLFKRINFCHA